MKKGIPEGAINGKFSVSATKKVYFSKGNLCCVSDTWSFSDNQWECIGYNQSDNQRDLFYVGTNDDTFDGWSSNAISNGGNKAGLWHTLSKDEWTYLLNTRTVNGGQGSGHSYTSGQKVNNVLGVVLYPDDYTGELYTTAKSGNWSTFEDAGCVFLPAGGYNGRGSVNFVGRSGYYWSSTVKSSDVAYCVYFDSSSVTPDATNSYLYIGCSVRLVYNIK